MSRAPREARGCARCDAREAPRRIGSRALCLACFDAADPIERGPLTARSLAQASLSLSRRVAPVAVPLALAFEAPLMLVELASTAPLDYAVQSLYGLVSLVPDGALLALGAASIARRPLDVRDALARALRGYGRLLLTGLIAELRVLGFLLLLVVPGVRKALSFAIAAPIALHEGAMGHDACRASEARMRGHLGAAFGAYAAAWSPSALVTLADLGLDHALAGLAAAGQGEPGWAPFATLALHAASVVALVPVGALSAVLHARTR